MSDDIKTYTRKTGDESRQPCTVGLSQDKSPLSNIADLCVTRDSTIRGAIECLDRSEKQIVLVVDPDTRLIDTITDGDIRRAILSGMDLDTPVSELRKRRPTSPYPKPITAHRDTDSVELLRMMERECVRQIPLLDDADRVVGVVTMRDLLSADSLPLQAVVMAGGYGKRLRPLTEEMPKAMLHVGERPLLESIIDRLRDSGIRRVNVSTHYMADIIEHHFGDGTGFGVDISYVEEDRPLGTAGALGLLEAGDEPILVINGDILTRIDFRSMLEFHQDHKADLTLAVTPYEHRVPYGVIESEGVALRRIVEKPVLRRFVNAGIYLLNPDVCRRIPNGRKFDMTDLIEALSRDGGKIICFPVREYWLDIGRVEDYERAQREYAEVFKP